MRQVKITHTYVLDVDEDDLDTLDPVINAGVSIMEQFIKAQATKARDMRSDWKFMPKETE